MASGMWLPRRAAAASAASSSKVAAFPPTVTIMHNTAIVVRARIAASARLRVHIPSGAAAKSGAPRRSAGRNPSNTIPRRRATNMVTSPPFVTSYLFFPFGKTGVSAVGERVGAEARRELYSRSSLTYSGDVGQLHALRRTLGPPPTRRRETPPQRKALPPTAPSVVFSGRSRLVDALRQRFVAIEIGPEGSFQRLVSLFGGQTQRTARGCHRFRVPSDLGIHRGQHLENYRLSHP